MLSDKEEGLSWDALLHLFLPTPSLVPGRCSGKMGLHPFHKPWEAAHGLSLDVVSEDHFSHCRPLLGATHVFELLRRAIPAENAHTVPP